MDFSWITVDQLLNTAYDPKQLAQMDRGDTLELIRELAHRLQRALNEIKH